MSGEDSGLRPCAWRHSKLLAWRDCPGTCGEVAAKGLYTQKVRFCLLLRSLLAGLVVCAGILFAQTQERSLSFEAASVKPAAPGPGPLAVGMRGGPGCAELSALRTVVTPNRAVRYRGQDAVGRHRGEQTSAGFRPDDRKWRPKDEGIREKYAHGGRPAAN